MGENEETELTPRLMAVLETIAAALRRSACKPNPK